MQISQQQYDRINYVAQLASKVVAHKGTLQSILEGMSIYEPDYTAKNLALNSLIGSAEEYEKMVKKEVTA